MLYALVVTIFLNGTLVNLFTPTDSVEECRALLKHAQRDLQTISVGCIAYIPGK